MYYTGLLCEKRHEGKAVPTIGNIVFYLIIHAAIKFLHALQSFMRIPQRLSWYAIYYRDMSCYFVKSKRTLCFPFLSMVPYDWVSNWMR